jgi:hypothetical protein
MRFTACVIAFFGVLRKANVCSASESITHVQRSLLRQDVVFVPHQYCLLIKLRFMKNSQFPESSHVLHVAGMKGHPLDPVAWWLHYIRLVSAPPTAPAFCFQGHKPMVHRWFVSSFKSLLSRAGIDPTAFSGHSFRRGAASFSYLVGIPDLLIKHMGAWRSHVYQIYCDMSPTQKLSVHHSWFSAMQQGQLGSDLSAAPAV